MAVELQADIEKVSRIVAVPTVLEIVCRTTGLRFAAVARVTEERWIACAVLDTIDFGLTPGGEFPVHTTICGDVRQSREPIVVDDVEDDDIYRTHCATAIYGFRSVISVPIILADGSCFGTLCAFDPRPARLNAPETIGMFRLFADLIASHLNADRELAASKSDLLEERTDSELREQFIAVLAHDLRNPLTALTSGVSLLLKTPLNDRATMVVRMMRDSASRMAGLIDDVLDLARGRLGGGLIVNRDATLSLEPVLREVVAEFDATLPDRVVETDFALTAPINCDRGRMAQLFSNLLANALAYGDVDRPVRVRAVGDAESFELSVVNSGEPIPPSTLKRLFHPFYRGAARDNRQGLGLGLYIAHEIATAHGGTLTVTSTEEETRFTFRMPAVRSPA